METDIQSHNPLQNGGLEISTQPIPIASTSDFHFWVNTVKAFRVDCSTYGHIDKTFFELVNDENESTYETHSRKGLLPTLLLLSGAEKGICFLGELKLILASAVLKLLAQLQLFSLKLSLQH